MDIKSGTDLIASVEGKPLGFSATCKIATNAQTAERATKESGTGKFVVKYVKSLSEQITAEGFVATESRTTYEYLKKLMLAAQPLDLTYCFVGETKAQSGTYILTSLDLDAPAGDDAKYSVTFESTGIFGETDKVTKQEYTKTTLKADSGAAASSTGR